MFSRTMATKFVRRCFWGICLRSNLRMLFWLFFLNVILFCLLVLWPFSEQSQLSEDAIFSTRNLQNSQHGEQKRTIKKSNIKNTKSQIEMCPLVSPKLIGWTNISSVAANSWNEKKFTFYPRLIETGIKMGGKYKPSDCQSRHKLAIVVPFRQRKKHLKVFLQYIHPFLQRQQMEYTIFVVEQTDGSPFNRGMLMNIGYKEALKQDIFHCFIFHDVDLLPEDDRNLYSCPEIGKPRQMAFSMDIYDYKMAPKTYFGGVNAFSSSDFQLVNGFSNLFWGWGSEDDDLYRRVIHHNLTVTRLFDMNPSLVYISRYKMLDHDWVNPNPDRDWLFNDGKIRIKSDGLNDLHYLIFKIKSKIFYTHIIVDIQKQ